MTYPRMVGLERRIAAIALAGLIGAVAVGAAVGAAIDHAIRRRL